MIAHRWAKPLAIAVAGAILAVSLIEPVLSQSLDGQLALLQIMRIPSPEDTSSWFPDLAVDSEGRVHVVWCESDHRAMNAAVEGKQVDPSRFERVYYSVWDERRWSPATDIVPFQQDIIRNAIAVDVAGHLRLLFNSNPPFSLYFKDAPAQGAWSAAAWSSPKLVNGKRATYWSDIAVAGDAIHIVYDDRGAEDGDCPGCSDIFYRNSSDGGRTWSLPVNLLPSEVGASRVQMEIDRNGVIHVTWDEGWDRLSGMGGPQYSVYIRSVDGGKTWSPPTFVKQPEQTAQLAVGSDGRGGVMLVWRSASPSHPAVYYMWSSDLGLTWSTPMTVPHILARTWTDPFDTYDMATDSAGNIHLVAGAYPEGTETQQSGIDIPPHALYHLVWNGFEWSLPSVIYDRNWYPAYPHIVVERGNRLHITWHIRENPWDERTPHQVWYAQASLPAPSETPVPTRTPTPTPLPEPEAAPTSTPTPFPTVDPGTMRPLPDGLYTDADDALRLAVALAPVACVLIVAIGIRLRWFRRR